MDSPSARIEHEDNAATAASDLVEVAPPLEEILPEGLDDSTVPVPANDPVVQSDPHNPDDPPIPDVADNSGPAIVEPDIVVESPDVPTNLEPSTALSGATEPQKEEPTTIEQSLVEIMVTGVVSNDTPVQGSAAAILPVEERDASTNEMPDAAVRPELDALLADEVIDTGDLSSSQPAQVESETEDVAAVLPQKESAGVRDDILDDIPQAEVEVGQPESDDPIRVARDDSKVVEAVNLDPATVGLPPAGIDAGPESDPVPPVDIGSAERNVEAEEPALTQHQIDTLSLEPSTEAVATTGLEEQVPPVVLEKESHAEPLPSTEDVETTELKEQVPPLVIEKEPDSPIAVLDALGPANDAGAAEADDQSAVAPLAVTDNNVPEVAVSHPDVQEALAPIAEDLTKDMDASPTESDPPAPQTTGPEPEPLLAASKLEEPVISALEGTSDAVTQQESTISISAPQAAVSLPESAASISRPEDVDADVPVEPAVLVDSEPSDSNPPMEDTPELEQHRPQEDKFAISTAMEEDLTEKEEDLPKAVEPVTTSIPDIQEHSGVVEDEHPTVTPLEPDDLERASGELDPLDDSEAIVDAVDGATTTVLAEDQPAIPEVTETEMLTQEDFPTTHVNTGIPEGGVSYLKPAGDTTTIEAAAPISEDHPEPSIIDAAVKSVDRPNSDPHSSEDNVETPAQASPDIDQSKVMDQLPHQDPVVDETLTDIPSNATGPGNAATTVIDEEIIHHTSDHAVDPNTEVTETPTHVIAMEPELTPDASTSVVEDDTPVVAVPNEEPQIPVQDQVQTTAVNDTEDPREDGSLVDALEATASAVVSGEPAVVLADPDLTVPVAETQSSDNAAIEAEDLVKPPPAVNESALIESEALTVTDAKLGIVEEPLGNNTEGLPATEQPKHDAETILADDELQSEVLQGTFYSVMESAVLLKGTFAAAAAVETDPDELQTSPSASSNLDRSSTPPDNALSSTGFSTEVTSTASDAVPHAPEIEAVSAGIAANDLQVSVDALKSAIDIAPSTHPIDVTDASVHPDPQPTPQTFIAELEVLATLEPDSTQEDAPTISRDEAAKLGDSFPNLTQTSTTLPNNDITETGFQPIKDASFEASADTEVLVPQAEPDSSKEETPTIACEATLDAVSDVTQTFVPNDNIQHEAAASNTTEPEILAPQAPPDSPKGPVPAIAYEATESKATVSDMTQPTTFPDNDITATEDSGLEATVSEVFTPEATPDFSREDYATTSREAAKLEEIISDVTQTSAIPNNDIDEPDFQLVKDASLEATTTNVAEPEVLAPQAKTDASKEDVSAIPFEATVSNEVVSDAPQTSAVLTKPVAEADPEPVNGGTVEATASECEVLGPETTRNPAKENVGPVIGKAENLDQIISDVTQTSALSKTDTAETVLQLITAASPEASMAVTEPEVLAHEAKPDFSRETFL